jgi:uncharacterized protein (TIRG00374 family)
VKGALRTAAHAAAIALGLGLLVLMVARVGPLKLWAEIARGGPALLWLLPVSLAWFALNTWGWRLAVDAPVPFTPLLRAYLCAEAVNNLTPFMALGGEPLKLTLLRRHLKVDVALASVIGDNVVHALSAPFFMAAGLALGTHAFRIDPSLRAGALAATALLGLMAFALWAAGGRGLAAALSRGIARRLGLADPGWAEGAARVDQRLRGFLAGRTRRFWASLALHLAGRVLGAVEAWLIMAALGVPFSLAAAMFVIAVAHAGVNLLFSFIPSQIGVQETAACLIFSAIGLDPASALALMLIRRTRGFLWIGIGLALLAPTRRSQG